MYDYFNEKDFPNYRKEQGPARRSPFLCHRQG